MVAWKLRDEAMPTTGVAYFDGRDYFELREKAYIRFKTGRVQPS